MSGFLADVGELFEVAVAADCGEAATDWAIVVQRDGAIRMMDASGWQLPALAAHTGAQTVYRVTSRGGHVRVEGRSGGRSCRLESESPARRAAALFPPRPLPFSVPIRQLPA